MTRARAFQKSLIAAVVASLVVLHLPAQAKKEVDGDFFDLSARDKDGVENFDKPARAKDKSEEFYKPARAKDKSEDFYKPARAKEKSEDLDKPARAKQKAGKNEKPAPVKEKVEETEKPERAAIICIHDVYMDSKKYSGFVEGMRIRGIGIYLIDVVGFQQAEFQVAYQSQVEDNLEKLVSALQDAHPREPIFLLGEGLGACLSTLYAAEHPTDVSGLILSAPAGQPFEKTRSVREYLQDVETLPASSADHIDDQVAMDYRHLYTKYEATLPKLYMEIPVLVLCGTEDPYSSTAQGNAIMLKMEHLKDAQAFFCKGMPRHVLERKDLEPEVLNAVDEWVAAHSPRRSTTRQYRAE